MIKDVQENNSIQGDIKRENRFLTTREIVALNKIRSQSYQPNKVYQVYLDTLENHTSESKSIVNQNRD